MSRAISRSEISTRRPNFTRSMSRRFAHCRTVTGRNPKRAAALSIETKSEPLSVIICDSVTFDSVQSNGIYSRIVDENGQQRKAFSASASKPIQPRIDNLSVTESSTVTVSWNDSPRMCYRELEPWLELANLFPADGVGPGFCKNDEVRRFYNAALDVFPEPQYMQGFEREALKEFPKGNPSPAVFFCETLFTEKTASQLYALGFAVRETFEALIRARQNYEDGEKFPALATGASRRVFEVMPEGRLRERNDVFHGKFLREALPRLKITRLARCEVCRRFMYAVREGQKTCSKRCNAVRRVRAWRARQGEYEYNRKLKSAGVKKKRSIGK